MRGERLYKTWLHAVGKPAERLTGTGKNPAGGSGFFHGREEAACQKARRGGGNKAPAPDDADAAGRACDPDGAGAARILSSRHSGRERR